MNTYRIQLLTALGIAVFTPVARQGRPLAEARGEADTYAERAVKLISRIKCGDGHIRLGESSIEKRPIDGKARTMFFMRMGAWWFPNAFPKFTSEFTASHFPVTECWVVRTGVEVDAESKEEAEKKAQLDIIVRASADQALLGEFDFFCRRLGVATRVS